MSSGGDLKVSYYTAILAKCLKQNDGTKFTDYYDLINAIAPKEQLDEAVDKADNFSKLPLATLSGKIAWCESLGVEPLTLVEKKSFKKPIKKLACDKPRTDISAVKSGTSDESFFLPDTNNVGYREGRSLVELCDKMASHEQRVVEFIDGVDEDVSPEDPQPIPTLTGNRNAELEPLLPEAKKKNSALIEVTQTVTEKKNDYVPAGGDCCIDMTDMIADMEDAINCGKTAEPMLYTVDDHSKNASLNKSSANEGLPSKSFEMTDMSSRISEGQTVWHVKDLKSPDDSDNGSEPRKKVKKKKKQKSKGNAGEHDQDEHHKNVHDESIKTKNMETHPLLGSDSNNNRTKPSFNNEKQKKRTIKSYQLERDARISNASKGELTNLAPFGNTSYGTHTSKPVSKSEQRKKEELKKQELLNDDAVNEILLLCGDSADVSTKTKKKSKEWKNLLQKKDKKKSKKQRKGDKNKSPEPSRSVEQSTAPDAIEEPKSGPVLSFGEPSTSEGIMMAPDVGDNQFITQRRRRQMSKQLNGGRTAAHSADARKRRFSDPAPVVNASQGQTDELRPSSPQMRHAIREAMNYRPGKREVIQDDLYDASQWPTLSAPVEAGNCGATSNPKTASYASKLKSNLDSTGCSLASSSEDGSSTSSTSSNHFPPCSTGQMSPVNDQSNTYNILSNLLLSIDATTDCISKSNYPKNAHPQPLPSIKPKQEDLQPVQIVNKIVDVSKRGKNNNETVKPKATEGKPETSLSSSQNKSLATINCQKEDLSFTKKVPLAKNAKKVTSTKSAEKNIKSGHDDLRKIPSENTGDVKGEKMSVVAPPGELKVLSELENKWGLDFFTDDFSHTDSIKDLRNEKPTVSAVLVENEVQQVTFGDDKLVLNQFECEIVPAAAAAAAVKPKSQGEVKTVSFPSIEMRISGDTTKWNDPGNFDMKKATYFLMQEWKSVSDQATYYEDD